MSNASLNAIQSAALEYIRQGYAVIPAFSDKMLIDGEKLNLLRRSGFLPDRLFYWLAQKLCKTPLRVRLAIRPLLTEAQARQWFGRYPQANILLVTGRAADIVVLDVDFHRKAHAKIATLALPETRRVVTGRGEHYYFRYPADAFVTRSHLHRNFLLGDACDVIVPPSVHIVGKPYSWANPDAEIASLPPVLCQAPRAFIARPYLIHAYRAAKNSLFIYLLYPLTRLYFQARFLSVRATASAQKAP